MIGTQNLLAFIVIERRANMKKQFDSDTAALEQRIVANKTTRYDLEEWILSQIKLNPNMKVLDLGCGTGKQVFALQKFLSTESKIIGVDTSPDAVAQINQRSAKEAVTNVKAVECELDNVIDYFQGSSFDLIVSTYAIYYSKNMPQLLSSLTGLMNPKAQMFICGYGKGTNQEIYNLVNELSVSDSTKIKSIEDFIDMDQVENISQHYASHHVVRLPNKVIFSSPDDILSWWTNHNSYNPEIHQEVRRALENYFSGNEFYFLSKNVLGIYFEF